MHHALFAIFRHGLLLGPWLVLVSCAGAGPAQFEPRFLAVHTAMAAMGVPQTGPIQQGTLSEGEEARFPFPLQAGECKTVVALADESVRDLNLSVVANGGRLVSNDSTVGRSAATRVCSATQAMLELVVTMASGGGGYTISYWGGEAGSGTMVESSGGGSQRAGTCDNPAPITLGVPQRDSTEGAGRMIQGSCVQGNAPERIYRIEVPERSQLSVVLQSRFDGALYLLNNCRDPRTEILCNDDHPDTSRSQLDSTVEAGVYYLVVDGFGEESGNYDLLVSLTPLQPVASVCSSATPLRFGQTARGTTVGNLNQFQATCANGAQSPDAVYQLSVPSRSRIRVRQTSSHDGALHLRSQCDEPTSELACNDDSTDERHSVITAVVNQGEYYVVTDGFGAVQAGTFALDAEMTQPNGTGIAADRCDNMGALRPGAVSLDSFNATDDFAGSCGGRGAPDLVYEVNVRQRSRLRVHVQQSEFESALYLQRACGGNAAEVACVAASQVATAGPLPGGVRAQDRAAPSRIAPPPPAPPPPGPRVTGELTLDTVLTPGRYFLVVDGERPDAFGSIELDVQVEDLAALTRSCQSAPLLRPGRQASGDTGGSADRFQASCAGGTRSQDIVYRLRVPRRQRVQVSMTSDYDGALHLRSDCTDPESELTCNDDLQDNQHAMIEQVLDAGTYYVIVDGFGRGNAGSYTLDVEMNDP